MNELVKIQKDQVVTSSRKIAEVFEKRHDNVLKDIDNLIEGSPKKIGSLFYETNYTHPQNKQEYREILMNRDGFTLVAMGFTGKKALQWKLKYIEAFNKMEDVIRKNQLITNNLSPELQVLINLELKQKQLEESITENKQEIQDMRDVIQLDTKSWRKDTTKLINKIATKIGGFEHIKSVREESYKLLDSRMGVDIQRRLINKRMRMADEGVSKSKRDKLNYLDIIAEDKKLIEGYTAIIKEMAIRYGVA